MVNKKWNLWDLNPRAFLEIKMSIPEDPFKIFI
jgi:hypothetical protein